MEQYSILQASQMLGMPKDTLRYYDKLGLVCPKRGDNRYRCYTGQNLLDLQFIEVMKYGQFSLAEIRLLFRFRRAQGGEVDYSQAVQLYADKRAERQVPKSEAALTAISEEIVRHKRRRYPRANLLMRILYPSRVKYTDMLPECDKGYTVSDKCTGCGLCARACPCHNIELVEGRPAFKHECNFCMSCLAYCPVRAINYEVSPELREKYPFFEFRVAEDRPRYHNPYVSAADISADRRQIKGQNRLK